MSYFSFDNVSRQAGFIINSTTDYLDEHRFKSLDPCKFV